MDEKYKRFLESADAVRENSANSTFTQRLITVTITAEESLAYTLKFALEDMREQDLLAYIEQSRRRPEQRLRRPCDVATLALARG